MYVNVISDMEKGPKSIFDHFHFLYTYHFNKQDQADPLMKSIFA